VPKFEESLTSFLPGRDFASPAEFNARLGQWLAALNTRPRRALGCAPADRITADKAAMLALPPVAPATGSYIPKADRLISATASQERSFGTKCY